jgi:hypothetical protein
LYLSKGKLEEGMAEDDIYKSKERKRNDKISFD